MAESRALPAEALDRLHQMQLHQLIQIYSQYSPFLVKFSWVAPVINEGHTFERIYRRYCSLYQYEPRWVKRS